MALAIPSFIDELENSVRHMNPAACLAEIQNRV
jgi:hypothetical protein